MILTYSQENPNQLKCIVMFSINSENLKFNIVLKKH